VERAKGRDTPVQTSRRPVSTDDLGRYVWVERAEVRNTPSDAAGSPVLRDDLTRSPGAKATEKRYALFDAVGRPVPQGDHTQDRLVEAPEERCHTPESVYRPGPAVDHVTNRLRKYVKGIRVFGVEAIVVLAFGEASQNRWLPVLKIPDMSVFVYERLRRRRRVVGGDRSADDEVVPVRERRGVDGRRGPMGHRPVVNFDHRQIDVLSTTQPRFDIGGWVSAGGRHHLLYRFGDGFSGVLYGALVQRGGRV
jgi:hypothetical protein